ncbi:MAG: NUDIX domain-containing protein [Ignavibacteriales bacterium]|nr:NUDIX domain-containing protein [Ignavibacteriales bacterium]
MGNPTAETNFEVVSSDVVRRGVVFDLTVDRIRYDDGVEGVREVAVHPGGAVVAAITDAGTIVVVRQFRYPLGAWMTELPAGKLDPDEDPDLCAPRELEEETGYRAGRIDKLGAIATTPGFCTEILHLYLARDLVAGAANRERGEEGMTVEEITFEEFDRRTLDGEIIDAKTIAAVALAKLRLARDDDA